MSKDKVYTADMGQPPQDIDGKSVTKAGKKDTSQIPGSGIIISKAKGGMIGSASKRADGCCTKGKTRGKVL
jgi:hypothetical protein